MKYIVICSSLILHIFIVFNFLVKEKNVVKKVKIV